MILNFEINSFVLLDHWWNSNTFPWRLVFLLANLWESSSPPSEPQGTLKLKVNRTSGDSGWAVAMEMWLQNKLIWSQREKCQGESPWESSFRAGGTSSWLKRVPQKNPVLECCLRRVPHSFGFPSGEIVKPCTLSRQAPTELVGEQVSPVTTPPIRNEDILKRRSCFSLWLSYSWNNGL